jgi:hypothetical protein
MACCGQFPLHVVDGEITFPQGHGQRPDAVAHGSRLGATPGLAEEGGPLFRVVTELVTEDPKGARRIAKPAGDGGGGFLVDEESAEGLVLALEGELRGEEELLVGLCCYLITRTRRHNPIVPQKHLAVKMFMEASPA